MAFLKDGVDVLVSDTMEVAFGNGIFVRDETGLPIETGIASLQGIVFVGMDVDKVSKIDVGDGVLVQARNRHTEKVVPSLRLFGRVLGERNVRDFQACIPITPIREVADYFQACIHYVTRNGTSKDIAFLLGVRISLVAEDRGNIKNIRGLFIKKGVGISIQDEDLMGRQAVPRDGGQANVSERTFLSRSIHIVPIRKIGHDIVTLEEKVTMVSAGNIILDGQKICKKNEESS